MWLAATGPRQLRRKLSGVAFLTTRGSARSNSLPS
jgi:hypothetical protein